jgi:hypothetical protein
VTTILLMSVLGLSIRSSATSPQRLKSANTKSLGVARVEVRRIVGERKAYHHS